MVSFSVQGMVSLRVQGMVSLRVQGMVFPVTSELLVLISMAAHKRLASDLLQPPPPLQHATVA